MSNKQPWRRIFAFLCFTSDLTDGNQTRPGWLTTHPEDTKFNYALKRVSEQALKCNEEITRKTEDIEIDNQATGEHGVLLFNPDGSRAHTAQGEKDLREARKALLDFEFEIEPHYCSELPELSEGTRQLLTGFVIKEESALRDVSAVNE